MSTLPTGPWGPDRLPQTDEELADFHQHGPGLPEKYQTTERTCRYGHGALKLVPGTWVLPAVRWGWMIQQHPKAGYAVNATGQVFTVRVAACETCGYVEMIDHPGGAR